MQPQNITFLPNNHLNNYPNKRKSPTNYSIPPSRSHGSTAQACAACKYQRRKCTPDCVLAPYFPHDRQRQFLNAHRLFGVSNIVKIVKHLQPQAKDHAMRTIIFQSDARAADPVGGCYRIIQELEQRICFAQVELDCVIHHVAICRAATTTHHHVTNDRETEIGWDEKWREQFETAVVDDEDSWGRMHGNYENDNVHGNADSTSSPLQPNHVKKVSLEECNGGINANFDQLPPLQPNHVMKVLLEECNGGINANFDQLPCDDDLKG